MSTLVVDASVAIKWIISEEDSPLALSLKANNRIIAPQLVYAECANIIWKKAWRGEIPSSAVHEYAALVTDLDIDTASLRGLVPQASKLSQAYDHPVYDCFYLALALIENCLFVTADQSFHRKLWQSARPEREVCVLLRDVAASG